MRKWKLHFGREKTEEAGPAQKDGPPAQKDGKKTPPSAERREQAKDAMKEIPRVVDCGDQFVYATLVTQLCTKIAESKDPKNDWAKPTVKSLLAHLAMEGAWSSMEMLMVDKEIKMDTEAFVSHLLPVWYKRSKAWSVVQDFQGVCIANGCYDARMRVVLLQLAEELNLSKFEVLLYEQQVAEILARRKIEYADVIEAERQEQLRRKKRSRWIKIGIGGVVGGAIIGLTGGLAAPLVAVGAGAVLGTSAAVTLGSTMGIYAIGMLFGGVGVTLTGYKMKKRVGKLKQFEFEPLSDEGHMTVTICISGWVTSDDELEDYIEPWSSIDLPTELFSLVWEYPELYALGNAFEALLTNEAVGFAVNQVLTHTALAAILSAIAWPLAVIKAASLIDNSWSVASNRAEEAGDELANALLSRCQGGRPVVLVGFSLGARVIYFCLKELAKRTGGLGIVQDVYLFGALVSGETQEWEGVQHVVAGQIFNGYCTSDWLCRFLFRTTSAQMQVAGLSGVSHPAVRNVCVDSIVNGHLDYKAKLPALLQFAGLKSTQRGPVVPGSLGSRVYVKGHGRGIVRFVGPKVGEMPIPAEQPKPKSKRGSKASVATMPEGQGEPAADPASSKQEGAQPDAPTAGEASAAEPPTGSSRRASVASVGGGKRGSKVFDEQAYEHSTDASCGGKAWVGVTLDTPTGDHDGTVEDHTYFTCRPGHGVLVPRSECIVWERLPKVIDKHTCYSCHCAMASEDAATSCYSPLCRRQTEKDLAAAQAALEAAEAKEREEQELAELAKLGEEQAKEDAPVDQGKEAGELVGELTTPSDQQRRPAAPSDEATEAALNPATSKQEATAPLVEGASEANKEAEC